MTKKNAKADSGIKTAAKGKKPMPQKALSPEAKATIFSWLKDIGIAIFNVIVTKLASKKAKEKDNEKKTADSPSADEEKGEKDKE
jgi:hypothetical protein